MPSIARMSTHGLKSSASLRKTPHFGSLNPLGWSDLVQKTVKSQFESIREEMAPGACEPSIRR